MSQVLSFGRFELRPAERVLRVAGEPVAVGARAYDVLLALAERSDRLVTKDELFDLVWPGLVVEENNLTVQVSALRRVIGHDAIATVTGRGYRLALPRQDAEPAPPRADRAAASRIERRLAVVAQADVVGWGRLVARDATAALQAWKAVRSELIERGVPRFGGRVIELTPERLQIEFGSAVDAVDWALDLQQALAQARRDAAGLRMRIGLCVDDAIVDEGKLVGDGVSVAAEVHGCAGHDEVLVTGFVRELVERRLPARFEPMGERLVQQLQRPLALYRVLPQRQDAGVAPALRPAAAERLASLAVLPLAAEGPEADPYFGAGMTEEIIASLSLNRSFFVIAHSSTLRYRDSAADPSTIAAELGVRYLVVGTVRRAGRQLRIGVSLVRAEDARVIWQERYDGTDDDLFAFQARIAASVAAAVDPQVRQAEIARLRAHPTASFGAYDCLLRALAGIYRFEDAEFDGVGGLLERALTLDPDYAQAHALLAWWHSLRIGQGKATLADGAGRLAVEHAMRAARLDPRDAYCLTVAGHMMAWLQKQLTPALDLHEQALAINPSCAVAWARSGVTLAYLGRGEDALERVRQALRLSPFDQEAFTFHAASGMACLVAGRPDEAVAWLGKALRLNPRYNASRRLQIAALVLAGELDEARALAQELLAAAPNFTVTGFAEWYPMQPPHRDRLLQALRRAGIPD